MRGHGDEQSLKLALFLNTFEITSLQSLPTSNYYRMFNDLEYVVGLRAVRGRLHLQIQGFQSGDDLMPPLPCAFATSNQGPLRTKPHPFNPM